MITKILLSGANGYMGRVISGLIKKDETIEVILGFDVNTLTYSGFPIYDDISKTDIKADIIIDFSHPTAFDSILSYSKRTKTPIVFATTGLSEKQLTDLKELSKIVPVFYSANMSLGVNLLIDLVKRLSSIAHDKYDIEIIEKHHNRKVDAPSGTAIKIAQAINESIPNKLDYIYERESINTPRKNSELGISSIRGGTIVGEHSVIFAGHDEIIEIKHTAMSREIFATGSINAAKFLVGKKAGLYDMNDLFGG